jgi:hypothetical protein
MTRGGSGALAAVARCFRGLAETAARIPLALRQAKGVGLDETEGRMNGNLVPTRPSARGGEEAI